MSQEQISAATKWALVLTGGLAMAGAHYLALSFAPDEATMGAVQRIFYFHVPSAWLCYIGFIIAFGASLAYLWSRDARHDALARAGVEVGLLFGLIVMATGPLWARAAWGVWWKWEPRLTSMALLVLMFAAYWVLRAYGGASEGVRRFAAVIAVFGAPNIIFVHLAVSRWRGDHPDGVVRRGLTGDMRIALYGSLAVLLALFVALLISRRRLYLQGIALGDLRRRLSRLERR